MSSTYDYNTRSKQMSDSKILDEISKLREELRENFMFSYFLYFPAAIWIGTRIIITEDYDLLPKSTLI